MKWNCPKCGEYISQQVRNSLEPTSECDCEFVCPGCKITLWYVFYPEDAQCLQAAGDKHSPDCPAGGPPRNGEPCCDEEVARREPQNGNS